MSTNFKTESQKIALAPTIREVKGVPRPRAQGCMLEVLKQVEHVHPEGWHCSLKVGGGVRTCRAFFRFFGKSCVVYSTPFLGSCSPRSPCTRGAPGAWRRVGVGRVVGRRAVRDPPPEVVGFVDNNNYRRLPIHSRRLSIWNTLSSYQKTFENGNCVIV